MVDNKHVIRSFIDKLNARDFDGAATLMTENCVHHTHSLGGGDVIGAASWGRFVRALWVSFPDRAITVHSIVGEGDRIAVRLTWTGTQKATYANVAATGKPVEVNGMSIFLMKDGKITEQWVEQDILKLYQELGAAPGQSDNWPKN